MPESAIEVVTAFVQDTLEASEEEALAGVSILWGPPVGDDRPREFVAVGASADDADSWESKRDWIGLGRTILDEDFTVHLAIQVEQHDGTNLQPALKRSVEIATAVEAELRKDPHMTGAEAQIRNVKMSRLRGRYFRSDQTRGHQVLLTITGIARF